MPLLILLNFAPMFCFDALGYSGYLLAVPSQIHENQVIERTIACVKGTIDDFQYFETIDIHDAQPKCINKDLPPEEAAIFCIKNEQ